MRGRSIVTGYLVFSLIITPVAPGRFIAFAQEVPSDTTVGGQSEETGAAAPVSDVGDQSQSDIIDIAPTDSLVGSAPEETQVAADSPSEQEPAEKEKKDKKEEPLPPEEESAMRSQSPGSSSGSDGTPNTIKQNIPDVDKSSGALRYELPLRFPPGRNGIEPNLSLIYNTFSQNPDSYVGHGWQFNIPYIRHINRTGADTMYTDAYYESSISGELVRVPSSSTVFLPKIEGGDFIRYELANSVWTATDKRGVLFTFGNSTSTRHIGPGQSSPIYAWMLAEVQDRNGNDMTYEYYQNEGQIYPSKIYYTSNGTSTSPFEIEFVREGVSSTISKYYAGFGTKTLSLIKEVKAKFNNSAVRTYSLGYASSTTNVRVVLDTVTESGQASSTTTLPAFNFDYQGGSGPFTNESLYVSCPTDMDTARGTFALDVNGDSWLDFMHSTNSVSTTYLGNGDLTWTASSTFNAPVVFWSSTSSINDLGIRTADINGDGRVDLLKRPANSTSSIYLSTASGWSLYTGAGWSIPEEFVDAAGGDRNVRIFDLNGDGLPDIVRKHEDAAPQTLVYLNNGNGWSLDTTWTIPVSNFKNGVIIADINNDGLMDILRSYRASPNSWTREAYLNNGNRTWALENAYAPPVEFSNNGSDLGVREADVNGDGYSDLIQAIEGGTDTVYLNIGTGWAPSSAWSPSWDFITSTGADTGTRLADYNGDGLVDALDCNGNQSGAFYENPGSLYPGARADILIRAKNPYGGATTVFYKPTPQFKNGSAILNPELPFTLDAVERIIHGDGISPSSTKIFAYQGGKQYFANALDRRSAGFAKAITTDSASNTATYYFHQGDGTNSAQGEYSDDQAKIGRVYRTELADSGGSIFTKLVDRWEHSTNASSSFVWLARSTALQYDGDSDHKDSGVNYTYATSTGNLTQKKEWGEVSASDDGSFTDTGTDLRITNITYASNTAAYVLGLPASEETTNYSSAKVRESKYYYDGGTLGTVDKGNTTKVERWITGASYVSSTKAYHPYGVAVQEIDPRGQATSFVYDSLILYPATTTNALGHSVSAVYDYASGQPIQKRDANGLATVTVLDGLGRILEERQPDLNTTSTLVTRRTVSYTDSYGASSMLEAQYLSSTASTTQHTYFDGFGRVIQTRARAEATDTYAVVDTAYNVLERTDKSSLPYFATGSAKGTATTTTALYTQYGYDALLRIASTTTAVGTTYAARDDWKTTITDPRGKVKHLYTDAFGNLNRVDEVNASSTHTTSYEYDANNNLTRITDALGNLRSFTYDGLSRRLTAEDLHASGDGSFGVWTYTYDAAGNVSTTVDPKSQTVEYAYDALGRTLTENYTGSAGTEQSYSYDHCLLGIGRLCEASSTISVSTAYQYNGLGGIARETKTVSSTAYQTNYTYDRQGNQLTILNPDNSEVKYTYNAAGRVETVQWKESGGSYNDVVLDFDYGPHGKVTYQDNANCTETTNTYDATKAYRLASIVTMYTCTAEESMMMSGAAEQRTIGVTPQNAKEMRDREKKNEKEPKSATSTKPTSFMDSVEDFFSGFGGAVIGLFTPSVAQAEELYNHSLYSDPYLVAYWRLEGNSSSSVGSYNGTDTSVNYGTSTGQYGQGAAFTIANNSRITTSGMGTITTFSVSLWAQLTPDYSGTQQDGGLWGNNDGWNGYGQPYAYLRSSTNNPNTSGGSWLLLNEYGDDPDNASVGAAYGQIDFNDNLWHHVVITYDNASKTEKYYVDGDIVRTNVFTSRPSTTFNNFTIGSSRFGGSWRTHAGNIDDVAVFNRVLTAAEISSLYSGGPIGTLQSLSFTYDQSGNITKIIDASGTDTSKTIDYTYDDLNRLLSASSSLASSGSNYSHLYVYDAIGNITSSTPVGSYAYGGGTYTNPHAATTVASTSYSYDNNGNLTSDGTWTHSWDYRNRLFTSSSTTKLVNYAYDHSNTRVHFKTSNTTSTVIASGNYSVENGTPIKYISANGVMLATVRGSGTSTASAYWMHPDHLGSQEKTTDDSGSLSELTDYYPFGNQRQNSGSLNDRKGYLSKDLDSDTGLSQLEARYYKSGVGRFVSQDPVFWEVGAKKEATQLILQNPQALNSYAYGNNNPIVNKDSNGRFVFALPLMPFAISGAELFWAGIMSTAAVTAGTIITNSNHLPTVPQSRWHEAQDTTPYISFGEPGPQIPTDPKLPPPGSPLWKTIGGLGILTITRIAENYLQGEDIKRTGEEFTEKTAKNGDSQNTTVHSLSPGPSIFRYSPNYSFNSGRTDTQNQSSQPAGLGGSSAMGSLLSRLSSVLSQLNSILSGSN